MLLLLGLPVVAQVQGCSLYLSVYFDISFDMDPFKRTDIRKHGIGVYVLFPLISSCGQSYELGMFDVPPFLRKLAK